MKKRGLWISAPIIVGLGLAWAMVFLVFDPAPLVSSHPDLTLDNVKQVKKLIQDGKPRDLKQKQIKSVTLTQADVNLVLNYGVQHGLGWDRVFTHVSLAANVVEAQLTVHFSDNPHLKIFGRFLNLSMVLTGKGPRPTLQTLTIGKLKLPGVFVNPVLTALHRVLANAGAYQGLVRQTRALQDMSIEPGRITIVYEWDPEAMGRIQTGGKSLLLSKDHQERLVLYHNALADMLKPHQNRKLSLTHVLRTMFALAENQSAAGSRPDQENMALVQVLALYSVRIGIKDFVGLDLQRRIKPRVPVTLTIDGRRDLAQHYLVSAGIAVSAGSRLSSFVGLAKEVDDADRGSGFSFADLAADKAGVKTGTLAVASSEQAARLQKRMKSVLTESDFMPDITHLPEGIREMEFRRRYTDLDSETYALVSEEIDRRISACPVYQ